MATCCFSVDTIAWYRMDRRELLIDVARQFGVHKLLNLIKGRVPLFLEEFYWCVTRPSRVVGLLLEFVRP